MLNKTSDGIHTFSVHTTLTAKRYYQIKKSLPELCCENANYWKDYENYYCGSFKKNGVKLYLTRYGELYMIGIRIEPCLVLGSKVPIDLSMSVS